MITRSLGSFTPMPFLCLNIVSSLLAIWIVNFGMIKVHACGFLTRTFFVTKSVMWNI